MIEHPITPGIKAFLISIGSADIDMDLLKGGLMTSATAGPGAGGQSFFISSGQHRVRLAINKRSPLKVVPWGAGIAIRKGEEIIATGYLESPLIHCPKQAYITISEQCIYDCKFCPVPKLQGDIKDLPTILRMVDEANARGGLQAIAITSGVAKSPDDEVQKTAEIVRALRQRYSVPIGVSVYPTKTSSEQLFTAGADEIKYNVETMDTKIFTQICPGLSLDFILESLRNAVPIFGKNHVFSNFIIGLGEDDACVVNGVKTLATMGVIPILRPISKSPLREHDIHIERPTAARLIALTKKTKKILNRYGFDLFQAKTMCIPCTGCDLTPFRDI